MVSDVYTTIPWCRMSTTREIATRRVPYVSIRRRPCAPNRPDLVHGAVLSPGASRVSKGLCRTPADARLLDHDEVVEPFLCASHSLGSAWLWLTHNGRGTTGHRVDDVPVDHAALPVSRTGVTRRAGST